MNRNVVRRLFRITLIVLSLGIVLGYGYFRSSDVRRGPVITITEPYNGYVSSTTSLLIRGIAKNVQELTLNGYPLLIDKQGNFSDVYIQAPGRNIVVIRGIDRFGEIVTVERETYYQDTLLQK